MTERLIAVRSDETVEFEYKGVIFKIGVLPRNIYGKFTSVAAKLNSGKLRDGELFDVQWEVVRHGVKGHDGLCFSDGSDVPFKDQMHRGGNGKTMIVSEETMDIYYASKLIDTLSANVVSGGASGKVSDQSEES